MGDVAGHEFHGNQWSTAHADAVQEKINEVMKGGATQANMDKAMNIHREAMKELAPKKGDIVTHRDGTRFTVQKVAGGTVSGRPVGKGGRAYGAVPSMITHIERQSGKSQLSARIEGLELAVTNLGKLIMQREEFLWNKVGGNVNEGYSGRKLDDDQAWYEDPVDLSAEEFGWSDAARAASAEARKTLHEKAEKHDAFVSKLPSTAQDSKDRHAGIAKGIREAVGHEKPPRESPQKGDSEFAKGHREGWHTAREVLHGRSLPEGLGTLKPTRAPNAD